MDEVRLVLVAIDANGSCQDRKYEDQEGREEGEALDNLLLALDVLFFDPEGVNLHGHLSDFEVVGAPVLEVKNDDQQHESDWQYWQNGIPHLLDLVLQVRVVDTAIHRVQRHLACSNKVRGRQNLLRTVRRQHANIPRIDMLLNLIIRNTITKMTEIVMKTSAPTDTSVKLMIAFVSHQ